MRLRLRAIKALAAIALFVSVTPQNCVASDGDSLTQRKQILSACTPDATRVLNAMINHRFAIAIEEVNRRDNPCKHDLEQAILGQVGDIRVLGISFPIGQLEKPVDRGLTTKLKVDGERITIPSFKIDRKESIYADAKLLESPGVVLGMASHVKICNLVIGSDKLTHFFAQGYEYIEVQRESGVRAAVQHGIGTEKGKYGLEGNGIYSYGDLAANYSGYSFWLQLTHPELGHFAKCNGKWVQTRRFCWRRYVNPAWDEGINPPCGPAVDRTYPHIRKLIACGRIAHFPPLNCNRVPQISAAYPCWVIPSILNPKTLAAFREMNREEAVTIASPDFGADLALES